MLSYVARRILVSIPTLVGAATVVFLMVRLLPGDPARVIAGVTATDEDVTRVRHQLGLDQPVPIQYVDFMARLLHGDLGNSARTAKLLRLAPERFLISPRYCSGTENVP